MTQTPEELAAPVVAEMKSAGKFDLSAALKKTSYPTQDVTVYLDGYKAHELNVLLDEVSELEHKAVGYSALGQGAMVDAPEKEAIDAEIAELKARELELIKEISRFGPDVLPPWPGSRSVASDRQGSPPQDQAPHQV